MPTVPPRPRVDESPLIPLRAAALVIAAFLVAGCAGAAATPSASSRPTGSALPAGTYTTKVFAPALTFTLPSGWENPTDSAAYLELRPLDNEVVGIHVFRDAVALSQASACPLEAEPGVASGASAMATWIRGLPGLTVGPPGLAAVGGLVGTVLDIRIKDGWKESCSFANGIPTVPLFFKPPDGYRWVLAGPERLRLYLLDVPGGGTVLVDIDDFDGSQMDAFLAAASPIVATFSFAKG